MKLRFSLPLFLACVLLGCVSTLLAQRPAGQSRTGVGVIDLKTITEKSNRFKASLDSLKQQSEVATAGFKTQRDKGTQLEQRLRTMSPDDPNRRALEGDLMKMAAQFDLQGKKAQSELMDKETQAVLAVGKELSDEMARYAQGTGLQLILRADPQLSDLSDPRAMMQEINKIIVYQREAEVGAPIVDSMNRRPAGATATRPADPKAPPQR